MRDNKASFDLPANTGFGKTFFRRAEEHNKAAPVARPDRTGMELRAQLMDAKTALELEVVGVLTTNAQLKHTVLVYELILTYDESIFQDSDGIVWSERDVVGFQVSTILTRFDAKTNVNLTNINLAARLDLAESEFYVNTWGITPIVAIPDIGVLNTEDGLTEVLKFLDSARAQLADTNEQYPPEKVSRIKGKVNISESDADLAIIFALKGIKDQVTLRDLLAQNASKGLDPWLITATYQDVTESFEPTDKPTQAHARKASDYLDFKLIHPTP